MRGVRFFMGLASLAVGLVGLPQAPRLKVAVNMTTIESFPVLSAIDSLRDAVDVLESANGRNAMAQLISGAADAATGSETQALLNSVADPRIRIVVTLSECRYRIVARRSSGIRRLSDLRGKRIAVTSNTSSQYYLSQMLAKAHLEERDVRLVSLEGQEMPSALDKHNIDAVSIWEPHAENSLTILGKDSVVFQDPSAYTERFNLNTRTDVLADPAKRVALVRLIREIARSSARIRTRAADMVPSLAPKIGFPDRTVFAVWRQFTFPASLNNGLRSALIDVERWVAANQNRHPRPDRVLFELIDPSVIEQTSK